MSTKTPKALLAAQRLIFREIHRSVALHSIRLEKAIEPDQYRVSYRLPGARESQVVHSLVPKLTATRSEYEAVEAWIDDRYKMAGGRPW